MADISETYATNREKNQSFKIKQPTMKRSRSACSRNSSRERGFWQDEGRNSNGQGRNYNEAEDE